MSDLPLYEKRCEGRTATVMGQPTLCEPCTDCLRRTSSRDGADFMPPPTFVHFWATWVCPQHVCASDYVVEIY